MLRFINNFKTTLAQPLAAASTQTFIQPADAVELAPLMDNTGGGHQLVLTLYDDVNVEIVMIDSANGNTGELHAYRAQENTTALNWPAGTKVAARLTARCVSALPVLAIAMQLTNADGVLQDAAGNILINPDMPTFMGGEDLFA